MTLSVGGGASVYMGVAVGTAVIGLVPRPLPLPLLVTSPPGITPMGFSPTPLPFFKLNTLVG